LLLTDKRLFFLTYYEHFTTNYLFGFDVKGIIQSDGIVMSGIDLIWIISIGCSIITIAYVIYVLKFDKTAKEENKKLRPNTGDKS